MPLSSDSFEHIERKFNQKGTEILQSHGSFEHLNMMFKQQDKKFCYMTGDNPVS